MGVHCSPVCVCVRRGRCSNVQLSKIYCTGSYNYVYRYLIAVEPNKLAIIIILTIPSDYLPVKSLNHILPINLTIISCSELYKVKAVRGL